MGREGQKGRSINCRLELLQDAPRALRSPEPSTPEMPALENRRQELELTKFSWPWCVSSPPEQDWGLVLYKVGSGQWATVQRDLSKMLLLLV